MNLGEVVANNHSHFVNGFLACYHHPYASCTLGANLFYQGLQIEHEAYVIAHVLANLVCHKQQTEVPTILLGTSIHIVVNHGYKTIGRNLGIFSAVKPVARGTLAHAHYLR